MNGSSTHQCKARYSHAGSELFLTTCVSIYLRQVEDNRDGCGHDSTERSLPGVEIWAIWEKTGHSSFRVEFLA